MTVPSSAFVPTDEQRDLRSVLRDLFASISTDEQVRAHVDSGEAVDRKAWQQLAELGLLGLPVPEKYGGAGATYTELAILTEEAGRALLCAPLLSSAVLATTALLQAGGEAAARFLPPMVGGDCVAALAASSRDRPWDPDGAAVTASETPSGWRLSGEARWVVDGGIADLLLVLARTGGRMALFAVSADDPGVCRNTVPGLDLTRTLALIELSDAAGVPVGPVGAGSNIVRRTYQAAEAMLAAEQVGGAGRVLEMAVEYAKIRYQFGRPIGSFQAVKHCCADNLIRLETARAVAQYAVGAIVEASDDLPLAVSLAKAYCSDAYVAMASDNIQILGGIGYTWEHPAHLYLKRAKSDQLLLGDPAFHRQLVAAEAGL